MWGTGYVTLKWVKYSKAEYLWEVLYDPRKLLTRRKTYIAAQ